MDKRDNKDMHEISDDCDNGENRDNNGAQENTDEVRSRVTAEFLDVCRDALEGILNNVRNLPVVDLQADGSAPTALIIMDMVNGFAVEGPLSSELIAEVIPPIVKLQNQWIEAGMPILAFADSHGAQSPEFDSFPIHCVTGSVESQVVDQIADIGGYDLIEKNSTNGFHEERFQQWLGENSQVSRFVVVGDCTDICVQQFAVSLKTWFDSKNRTSEVYVPISAVATFECDGHDSGLTELMAIYFMVNSGVQVVRDISMTGHAERQ